MELENILRSWEKHFFAKQYHDVKLDNIANDLGIKKPSLYYYFTNKRDFYLQTLRFSMKKYVKKLRSITEQNNLWSFIERYLDFPSKEQNLYAIAAQKGYWDDKEINSIINMWRQVINTDISNFFKQYNIKPITWFLICQLLDKLAMDNCIDGYCLEYSVDEITQELENIISNNER